MNACDSQSIACSQNFLKDSRLVASLLERCALGRNDLVYEIGAGQGIITRELALRCRQVVAIEKDPRLATGLRERLALCANVSVYAGDFLLAPLPRRPYKVFANIPFNITAAILSRLTSAANPPEMACLVLQKEAAERFTGVPCETLRSVLLKPWFATEVAYRFRRSDFAPAPRVDVVLLQMKKRGPPLVESGQRQWFRDFVVYAFTAWRPTLEQTLKGIFTRRQLSQWVRQSGFDLSIPPGAVPFLRWLDLFHYFQSVANREARHTVQGSEKRLARQQGKLHKLHRTRKNGP